MFDYTSEYLEEDEFKLKLMRSNGRSSRRIFYIEGELIKKLWLAKMITRTPRLSVMSTNEAIEKANAWITRNRQQLEQLTASEHQHEQR